MRWHCHIDTLGVMHFQLIETQNELFCEINLFNQICGHLWLSETIIRHVIIFLHDCLNHSIIEKQYRNLRNIRKLLLDLRWKRRPWYLCVSNQWFPFIYSEKFWKKGSHLVIDSWRMQQPCKFSSEVKYGQKNLQFAKRTSLLTFKGSKNM